MSPGPNTRSPSSASEKAVDDHLRDLGADSSERDDPDDHAKRFPLPLARFKDLFAPLIVQNASRSTAIPVQEDLRERVRQTLTEPVYAQFVDLAAKIGDQIILKNRNAESGIQAQRPSVDNSTSTSQTVTSHKPTGDVQSALFQATDAGTEHSNGITNLLKPASSSAMPPTSTSSIMPLHAIPSAPRAMVLLGNGGSDKGKGRALEKNNSRDNNREEPPVRPRFRPSSHSPYHRDDDRHTSSYQESHRHGQDDYTTRSRLAERSKSPRNGRIYPPQSEPTHVSIDHRENGAKPAPSMPTTTLSGYPRRLRSPRGRTPPGWSPGHKRRSRSPPSPRSRSDYKRPRYSLSPARGKPGSNERSGNSRDRYSPDRGRPPGFKLGRSRASSRSPSPLLSPSFSRRRVEGVARDTIGEGVAGLMRRRERSPYRGRERSPSSNHRDFPPRYPSTRHVSPPRRPERDHSPVPRRDREFPRDVSRYSSPDRRLGRRSSPEPPRGHHRSPNETVDFGRRNGLSPPRGRLGFSPRRDDRREYSPRRYHRSPPRYGRSPPRKEAAPSRSDRYDYGSSELPARAPAYRGRSRTPSNIPLQRDGESHIRRDVQRSSTNTVHGHPENSLSANAGRPRGDSIASSVASHPPPRAETECPLSQSDMAIDSVQPSNDAGPKPPVSTDEIPHSAQLAAECPQSPSSTLVDTSGHSQDAEPKSPAQAEKPQLQTEDTPSPSHTHADHGEAPMDVESDSPAPSETEDIPRPVQLELEGSRGSPYTLVDTVEPSMDVEPKSPAQTEEIPHPVPQVETDGSRKPSHMVDNVESSMDVETVSPVQTADIPHPLPQLDAEGLVGRLSPSVGPSELFGEVDTEACAQSDEVPHAASVRADISSEVAPQTEDSAKADNGSSTAEMLVVEQGSNVQVESQTDPADNGDYDSVMGDGERSSTVQESLLEPTITVDTTQPGNQDMAIAKRSKEITMRASSAQALQKEPPPKDDSSGSSMDLGSLPIRPTMEIPSPEDPGERLPTETTEQEPLDTSHAPGVQLATSPEQEEEEENVADDDSGVAMADGDDESHETLPSVLPVPGLWSVKVGPSTSTVVVIDFEIDAETASKYGIDGGDTDSTSESEPRASTAPSHGNGLRLDLLCLPTTTVAEAFQALSNPTPEEVASSVSKIPSRWPGLGTLIVELNPEKSWAQRWLGRHLALHPGGLDVTSFVRAGQNTMRLIQLGDHSSNIYVLHASDIGESKDQSALDDYLEKSF
ncbi:hypothetical protein HGRIS_003366 [Hohenbuehelia grisea]|uniref:Uncharacterized protein n=1 Tax=Hohenbuehelia grisea TaxID=104357 RepID=A0ABR3JFM8_9AGAR